MNRTIQHLLVVDDDTRIRDLLKKYLQEHHFYVSTAAHAQEARDKLKHFAFDLLILDVMMPGETGVELTRSLKKNSTTPIIMLTAMGEVEDRITGLECGADDYLPKPFEPRELLLRIRNVLQRVEQQRPEDNIRFGDYRFNIKTHTLQHKKKEIILTTQESQLLAIFTAHVEKPLTRDQIVQESHGTVSERSVDVQIKRLRSKIEQDSKKPRFIKTVRGTGYVFHKN